MVSTSMETYERECCIRGYHVYKDTWEAAIGENRWPLTEDASAHLLVLLEKWCDIYAVVSQEGESIQKV